MTAQGGIAVASLGYEFNHPRVRNIDYRSTDTILSADVVLWLPEPLNDLFPDYDLFDSSQYHGMPLISESRSQLSLLAADHRRSEIAGFLDLGRSLVLFAPAPHRWYYHTGTRDVSGTGKNQKITRHVDDMNTLDLLPFPLETTAASGRDIECRGTPIERAFWDTCGQLFQHAAYMENPLGSPFLFIARTGFAVGSYGSVGKGFVLVLPALAGDDDGDDADEADFPDEAFVDALLELVDELAQGRGKRVQPAWSQDLILPGETKAIDEVSLMTQQIGELSGRRMETEHSLVVLQSRKTLFTGTGRDLEEVVKQALEGLGFAVEHGAPGRADLIARAGKRVAVLEVKGLSKSAKERDAAQLEKWVAEHHVAEGNQPKGILVVNAYATTPLDRRSGSAFPAQMLKYAHGRELCLITGVQLLGAWLDAEQDPRRKGALRRSILDCVGVYPDYPDWTAFLEACPSELTDA
jgi:hypothetical protein